MKATLDFLIQVAKEIDLDEFYCTTIYVGQIKLHGKYKSDLVLSLRDKGFTNCIVAQNGYVQMTRSCVEITLTE